MFNKFLIEFCDCYDNSLPRFSNYILNKTNNTMTTCPKFIDSIYNCEYLIKKVFIYELNVIENLLIYCNKISK